MRLKVRALGIESGGKPIVTLSREDADELGITGSGRIRISKGKNEITGIVNVITKSVPTGIIGIYNEVAQLLKLKEGDVVEAEIAKFPSSLQFIRNKLKGKRLTRDEIFEIVKDVVEGNLNEIEIAAFVTSLNDRGLDMDEAANLTVAMVNTGEQLKLSRKPIVDKHSIGGVPGDKTSLLVVPIIAAAGLTIPKTSSRAITSAAGSADKAEVLMPVNLDMNEMKRIVEETGGCIVWGGSLHLSPSDDIFVQVEYPLSIDPLLLPSIMSKKKAVNTNYLAIDIPTGRGAKVKTIGEADLLAKDFISLGRKVDIHVECAVTYGEQPIGFSVGPAFEAKEALEILMNRKRVPEQIDKVCHIAGMLLEMAGKEHGRKIAEEILRSGKAEKKMREIIYQQGGDSEIKPEEIKTGEYGLEINSEDSGIVLWIDNNALVEVARAAGAPKDKEAGILLHKKLNDPVKKGERLFTVYTNKQKKLQRVEKVLSEEKVFGVADRREMLVHKVKETGVTKKSFILER